MTGVVQQAPQKLLRRHWGGVYIFNQEHSVWVVEFLPKSITWGRVVLSPAVHVENVPSKRQELPSQKPEKVFSPRTRVPFDEVASARLEGGIDRSEHFIVEWVEASFEIGPRQATLPGEYRLVNVIPM